MNYKKLFLSAIAGVSLFLLQSDTVNAQQCDTILADFSSNAPRCTGSAVDFLFTQNAYATMTYSWDFGSGASPATSTAKDPSGITYSTAGLKLVTLTVTHPGLGCTDTKTSGINIIEMPNPAFTDNGPQCEEAEVNFTYTGSSNTGWIYNWDFGTSSNPAVSSAQSPGGVKYFSPGTKSVTVTVTNGMCNASVSQNVTIQNKPNAGFSNATTSCTGDSVNFTNTGSTGLTYAWNFGSGASPATSTSENPQNIFYTSNGSKNIQQIVTQGSCSDTSLQAINIIQTPAPSFTTNAPQCEGAEVNLTYSGTTGTGWTYSWDFGNGSTPNVSSAQNPLGILYTGSGSKSVSLTVANQTCSENTTQNITINARPSAGLSVSSPACTNDSVSFSNTGSTGLTYAWNFGSGASPATSASENPLGIIYSSPGIKNITQIITQGTCTDTAFGTVSVTETPIPTFTHNAPQCEGAEVNFTYSGTTGTTWTYLWDFGTGATPALSSGTSPTGVTYSGSGSKTVTLSVTNQLCSETTTQNLNINFTPTAGFSNNAPGCTGDSINFLNGGSTGLTYNWDFGTGGSPATSTLENPVGIIYSSNGTKSIRQIVSQGSCVDTVIMSINIGETPAPNFTHNAPQCEGAPVNFTYSGSNGTGWTYLWDFGNGATPALSAGVNPGGIVYTGSGSKDVTVTVTNQLCSETSLQTITINPTPTSGFSSNAPGCTGDSINFLNGGSTGLTYNWSFDAGASPATSTLENPVGIIYSSNGTKRIRQIVSQGSCVDTTIMSINIGETPAPNFTHNAPQCEGAPVNFTYSGTTGTSWTYLWDFGTGSSPALSAGINPGGIVYTGSGSKNVSVTVTNQLCSETSLQTITINPTPTSGFSSNAPGCTGDSVNFLNGGSTGLTYAWNFGSNATPATSTSESPVGIIYSTPGIKTIQQIIVQGTCSDTTTTTINVKETPAPAFTDNGPRCEGSDVNFAYTGSTGIGWTYSWDFGNGSNPSTSSALSPSGIQYTGAGNKNVTLTVNNQGCSDTAFRNVTILFQPKASMSTTAPGCTGDTVLFNNTGTSGVAGTTYLWAFGNGSPSSSATENPPPVTFPNPGVETISLAITNGSCSDTIFENITIDETPSISITSNAPVCAMEAISFVNQGSNGSRWNFIWDFGSGASPSISTSETPSNIRYNVGGSKTINLTISDSKCSNSATAAINIFSLPVADAGTDTTICADRCVQIGDSSVAGNTYTWFPSSTLDDGFISNPKACPKASVNTYFVTVVDANNCVSRDTVTVTMLQSSIANAGPDVQACEGDTVQIGAALIEGQTYRWTPTAGLSDSTISSPVAKPDSTTEYTVSVSYKGCDIIKDDIVFTVYKNPNVSAGPDVKIARGQSTPLLATGGIMYQWTPLLGLSNPGIFNPIASPDETTIYVVEVTDQNSCQNTDSVTVTVVNADIWVPDAFTPNGDGVNDIFYIRNNGAVQFIFVVYNRNGELIFTTNNPDIGWDGTRQGTGEKMPSGAYVYSAKGELSDGNPFVQSGMVNLIR